MNENTTKETIDILNRLTPKNQAYFMTLVRVAEIAENSVKDTLTYQSCKIQAVALPELVVESERG